MKNIKLLLVFSFIITSFLLTSCTYVSETKETFSVSESDVLELKNIINEQFANSYWKYIENDTEFYSSFVENSSSNRYESIYNACLDSGFDISKYADKNIIVASTNIMHFNNSPAGTAYFYFFNKELIGKYYIDNDNIYSLNDIDPFIIPTEFKAYEDISKKTEFLEKSISVPFTSFEDISSRGDIATIDASNDFRLKVYKLRSNSKDFSLIKSSYIDNLQIISFQYTKDGAIALIGTLSNDNPTEGEFSETFSEEENIFDSKKIVFLDNNYKKTIEINLDINNYTSIAYQDDFKTIFASRENSLDVFKFDSLTNNFTKVEQISLNHWVDKIKFSDIDKDGINELIMTDGMDIYLYTMSEGNVELAWRTNLSIKSMNKNIYTGDLNNDRADEIYIEDLSETTVKYILTKNCIKVSKSDTPIPFGTKYLVGDFNIDGKCDYIEINSENSIKKLYLSK